MDVCLAIKQWLEELWHGTGILPPPRLPSLIFPAVSFAGPCCAIRYRRLEESQKAHTNNK